MKLTHRIDRVDNRYIMKNCKNMNVSRSNYAICSYQDYIYVAGGRGDITDINGDGINNVEKYDCKRNQWIELQSMPRNS